MDLQTPSDEAAKQYDAIITQLCGWYVDESLGGIESCLKRMLEADPEFVLGRALEIELNLLGGLTSPRFNKSLASTIDEFNKLVERKKDTISEQERLHAAAVNHMASNEFKKANNIFERIITLYPCDYSALKMNQDSYFFLGTALPMRNSFAYALPKIPDSDPLKGYAHGMFAFALEESNMYPQAQREAMRAIELIPRDTWAIHNYAHCLEMQGLVEDGLKWMHDRKIDWAPCQTLACHQYWHTALFSINNNKYDDAVALLDNDVLTRCVASGTSLDMHDASSMVFRMELVDLFGKANKTNRSQADRWKGVYEVCEPHKKDHLVGFHDAHYMMSFLGMNDLQSARELIETVDEAPSLNEGQTVVKPLLEAMYQFKTGSYAECADIMQNIRHDIIRIGGSHAQRDVFEQLLLVSALKSQKSEHNKLAQRMLVERDTFFGRRLNQTELLAQA